MTTQNFEFNGSRTVEFNQSLNQNVASPSVGFESLEVYMVGMLAVSFHNMQKAYQVKYYNMSAWPYSLLIVELSFSFTFLVTHFISRSGGNAS